MTHIFLDIYLNSSSENSSSEVTVFLNNLIWIVKDAVISMSYELGALEMVEENQILEIERRNTKSLYCCSSTYTLNPFLCKIRRRSLSQSWVSLGQLLPSCFARSSGCAFLLTYQISAPFIWTTVVRT